jgi:hypothetical protein
VMLCVNSQVQKRRFLHPYYSSCPFCKKQYDAWLIGGE